MLRPISTEVQNLMFLRDVIIPFVKEREKEGKVDLYNITHECGSPSCLAGWAYYQFRDQLGLPKVKIWQIIDELHNVLGTNSSYRLFAGPVHGTLDDRARAIDRIIERKINETADRQ